MGDEITLAQVTEEMAPDDVDGESRLTWVPTTLRDVDWLLQRKAEMEAEAREIEAQAAEAVRRIFARRDELQARALRGIQWASGMITGFAESHRDEMLTGKKKSRDFVHGRVQFRASAERLEITDKEALAAWLATQPVESGLYRVTLTPEMRALQEEFKRHGVVPPGCDVRPASETIHIECSAPEAALKGTTR